MGIALVLGICVLLLLLLSGKLSPTLSTFLILTLLLFWFGIRYTQDSSIPKELNNIPNSIEENSVIAKTHESKEHNGNVIESTKEEKVHEQKKDPIPPSPNIDISPDDAKELEDLKTQNSYITFTVKGILNSKIEEAISDATGFSPSRKGDYVISFSHSGAFDRIENNESGILEYVYTGGDMIIQVDDETCCCRGMVKIPKGIADNSLKVVEEELKNEIAKLFLANKEKIIPSLKSCLPNLS